MIESESPPLILSLALDEASFAFFDGQRRRHFPPERNHIPAHVTLFHHLPGAREAEIARELEAVCARQAPVLVTVTGLRSLGRGTAYTLEAPSLSDLRRDLAATWRAWLTPQDSQGFRPHVTVQNKVTPEAAKALLRRLQDGFEPFVARGEGLHLWRYLNGPWGLVGTFRFGAGQNATPLSRAGEGQG